ncbi:hypothetical protein [Anaerobiospirillum sp. NML120449]|uniref:hypothetical protein n=1 Tax=Anaerobiospirillum sp. NML120449 TaxID=2932817 RepID=UPI001FF54D24|nr:hypothetical protein [Anaerobiospirillum sp. NML120449]MCK0526465.1 hypothetical protein [Anaerobiospirillum sp. NML120449]
MSVQLAELMLPLRQAARQSFNSNTLYFLDGPIPEHLGFRLDITGQDRPMREAVARLEQSSLHQQVILAVEAADARCAALQGLIDAFVRKELNLQVGLVSSEIKSRAPSSAEKLRLLEINSFLSQQSRLKLSIYFLSMARALLGLYPLAWHLREIGFTPADLNLGSSVFGGFSPQHKERIALMAALFGSSGLTAVQKSRMAKEQQAQARQSAGAPQDHARKANATGAEAAGADATGSAGLSGCEGNCAVFSPVDFGQDACDRLELIARLIRCLCTVRDGGILYGFALAGLENVIQSLYSLARVNPELSIEQLVDQLAQYFANQPVPAIVRLNCLVNSPAWARSRMRLNGATADSRSALSPVSGNTQERLYKKDRNLVTFITPADLFGNSAGSLSIENAAGQMPSATSGLDTMPAAGIAPSHTSGLDISPAAGPSLTSGLDVTPAVAAATGASAAQSSHAAIAGTTESAAVIPSSAGDRNTAAEEPARARDRQSAAKVSDRAEGTKAALSAHEDSADAGHVSGSHHTAQSRAEGQQDQSGSKSKAQSSSSRHKAEQQDQDSDSTVVSESDKGNDSAGVQSQSADNESINSDSGMKFASGLAGALSLDNGSSSDSGLLDIAPAAGGNADSLLDIAPAAAPASAGSGQNSEPEHSPAAPEPATAVTDAAADAADAVLDAAGDDKTAAAAAAVAAPASAADAESDHAASESALHNQKKSAVHNEDQQLKGKSKSRSGGASDASTAHDREADSGSAGDHKAAHNKAQDSKSAKKGKNGAKSESGKDRSTKDKSAGRSRDSSLTEQKASGKERHGGRGRNRKEPRNDLYLGVEGMLAFLKDTDADDTSYTARARAHFDSVADRYLSKDEDQDSGSRRVFRGSLKEEETVESARSDAQATADSQTGTWVPKSNLFDDELPADKRRSSARSRAPLRTGSMASDEVSTSDSVGASAEGSTSNGTGARAVDITSAHKDISESQSGGLLIDAGGLLVTPAAGYSADDSTGLMVSRAGNATVSGLDLIPAATSGLELIPAASVQAQSDKSADNASDLGDHVLKAQDCATRTTSTLQSTDTASSADDSEAEFSESVESAGDNSADNKEASELQGLTVNSDSSSDNGFVITPAAAGAANSSAATISSAATHAASTAADRGAEAGGDDTSADRRAAAKASVTEGSAPDLQLVSAYDETGVESEGDEDETVSESAQSETADLESAQSHSAQSDSAGSSNAARNQMGNNSSQEQSFQDLTGLGLVNAASATRSASDISAADGTAAGIADNSDYESLTSDFAITPAVSQSQLSLSALSGSTVKLGNDSASLSLFNAADSQLAVESSTHNVLLGQTTLTGMTPASGIKAADTHDHSQGTGLGQSSLLLTPADAAAGLRAGSETGHTSDSRSDSDKAAGDEGRSTSIKEDISAVNDTVPAEAVSSGSESESLAQADADNEEHTHGVYDATEHSEADSDLDNDAELDAEVDSEDESDSGYSSDDEADPDDDLPEDLDEHDETSDHEDDLYLEAYGEDEADYSYDADIPYDDAQDDELADELELEGEDQDAPDGDLEDEDQDDHDIDDEAESEANAYEDEEESDSDIDSEKAGADTGDTDDVDDDLDDLEGASDEGESDLDGDDELYDLDDDYDEADDDSDFDDDAYADEVDEADDDYADLDDACKDDSDFDADVDADEVDEADYEADEVDEADDDYADLDDAGEAKGSAAHDSEEAAADDEDNGEDVTVVSVNSGNQLAKPQEKKSESYDKFNWTTRKLKASSVISTASGSSSSGAAVDAGAQAGSESSGSELSGSGEATGPAAAIADDSGDSARIEGSFDAITGSFIPAQVSADRRSSGTGGVPSDHNGQLPSSSDRAASASTDSAMGSAGVTGNDSAQDDFQQAHGRNGYGTTAGADAGNCIAAGTAAARGQAHTNAHATAHGGAAVGAGAANLNWDMVMDCDPELLRFKYCMLQAQSYLLSQAEYNRLMETRHDSSDMEISGSMGQDRGTGSLSARPLWAEVGRCRLMHVCGSPEYLEDVKNAMVAALSSNAADQQQLGRSVARFNYYGRVLGSTWSIMPNSEGSPYPSSSECSLASIRENESVQFVVGSLLLSAYAIYSQAHLSILRTSWQRIGKKPPFQA